MKRTALKAPFPWFGGKARVTGLVWSRLGDVANAIEPFCGSARWLLDRPTPPRIETINDVNSYVSNFWRATQHDPEAVAEYADWPVNEADLHSRHRWLVLSPAAAEFRQRMRRDPDYYDPKIAGWWCWGLCCWIGAGWCSDWGATADGDRKEVRPMIGGDGQYGTGINVKLAEQRPNLRGEDGAAGQGIHASAGSKKLRQPLPDISGESGAAGRGVNASAGPKNLKQKRPLVCGSGYGPGLHAKRPRISGAKAEGDGFGNGGECGVNARPQLGDAYAAGRGVHANDQAGTCAERRAWLVDWFGRLRDRLRCVRVCCGDWSRVCGSHSVTTRLGLTGVFLDPPYPRHNAHGTRDPNLYASDLAGADAKTPEQVRDEVLAWCIERGPDPLMRIAVCGYQGDGYEALEALGWEVVAWRAQGGYGNRGKQDAENVNAARERIWFSPGCVREKTLF